MFASEGNEGDSSAGWASALKAEGDDEVASGEESGQADWDVERISTGWSVEGVTTGVEGVSTGKASKVNDWVTGVVGDERRSSLVSRCAWDWEAKVVGGGIAVIRLARSGS